MKNGVSANAAASRAFRETNPILTKDLALINFAFITCDAPIDPALIMVGDQIVLGELHSPHLSRWIQRQVTKSSDVISAGNSRTILNDLVEDIGKQVIVIVNNTHEVTGG